MRKHVGDSIVSSPVRMIWIGPSLRNVGRSAALEAWILAWKVGLEVSMEVRMDSAWTARGLRMDVRMEVRMDSAWIARRVRMDSAWISGA